MVFAPRVGYNGFFSTLPVTCQTDLDWFILRNWFKSFTLNLSFCFRFLFLFTYYFFLTFYGITIMCPNFSSVMVTFMQVMINMYLLFHHLVFELYVVLRCAVFFCFLFFFFLLFLCVFCLLAYSLKFSNHIVSSSKY